MKKHLPFIAAGVSLLILAAYVFFFGYLGYANKRDLGKIKANIPVLQKEFQSANVKEGTLRWEHPDIHKLLDTYNYSSAIEDARALIDELREVEEKIDYLLESNSSLGREQAEQIIEKYLHLLPTQTKNLEIYMQMSQKAQKVKKGESVYMQDLSRFINNAANQANFTKTVLNRIVLPKNSNSLHNWQKKLRTNEENLRNLKAFIKHEYAKNNSDYFSIDKLLGEAIAVHNQVNQIYTTGYNHSSDWGTETLVVVTEVEASYDLKKTTKTCFGSSTSSSHSWSYGVTPSTYAAKKSTPVESKGYEKVIYYSQGNANVSCTILSVTNRSTKWSTTSSSYSAGDIISIKPKGYAGYEAKSNTSYYSLSGEFSKLYRKYSGYVGSGETPMSSFTHSESLICVDESDDTGFGGSTTSGSHNSPSSSSGSGGSYESLGNSDNQGYSELPGDY